MDLAEQQSALPLLIYLDQLEQLMLPGRDAAAGSAAPGEPGGADAQAHPRAAAGAVDARGLPGRFRDRARGRRALLEKTFRLSGLTVGEMAKVSCQIAAKGEPPQEWKEDELLALMLQVREPGQEPTQNAEVQAAFAQIVCRELWDKRLRKQNIGVAQAESMLHDYLERTLQGRLKEPKPARQLLEDHFISSDGSRTLLMEQQAREALAGLTPEQARRILDSLSAAAVLHWEEHGGSRYYELGHDWLARKVVDWKRANEAPGPPQTELDPGGRPGVRDGQPVAGMASSSGAWASGTRRSRPSAKPRPPASRPRTPSRTPRPPGSGRESMR